MGLSFTNFSLHSSKQLRVSLCCRYLLALLLSIALILPLCGCLDWQKKEKDDISLANEALRRRDTGDAAMYFERYLRKNPHGSERWQVWEEVLNIVLTERQDKEMSAEYLEIMLIEFNDQPERRRSIQLRLADISYELRKYAQAQILWEALIKDPELPVNIKARVLCELSRLYLLRLEFAAAIESLKVCLDLPASHTAKNECSYTLAETQMLTGDLDASTSTLRAILKDDLIADEQHALTVFMLADVSELQGRREEALQLFESIRNTFPNEKVIEMRISALKQRTQSMGSNGRRK